MKYLDFIKEQVSGKTICMYPMGIAAKATMQKIKAYGINVNYFSDSNSKLYGEEYKGVACIPKTQLIEMDQDELIVIVESLYYKEIKQDLQENGIKNILRIYPEKFLTDKFVEEKADILEERINAVLNICADEKSKKIFKYLTDSWKMDNIPDDYFESIYEKNQYFDSSVIKIHEHEVFVDGGAYIGDTAEKFLEFCNGRYEKIHLFELDPQIYNRLKDNMKKFEKDSGEQKIFCYPYGLSDENGEVHFSGGDSSSSINASMGEMVGSVRKMDDTLKDEKVTFIKMDIEGAEMAALKGCADIIKKQKPKLAICIYHSPEDMLSIPLYIKQLMPEYKIFIRHYTDMMLETVCYAVEEESI